MITSCPLCRSSAGPTIESFDALSCIRDIEQQLSIEFSEAVTQGVPEGQQYDLVRCQHCGLEWFRHAVPGSPDFYSEMSTADEDYYAAERFEFTAVADRLRPNDKVLDIGCGSGRFLQLAKPLVDHVEGIDMSQDAVQRARESGMKVHHGSPTDFSLGQRFSVVCAFQILEHLDDVGNTLEAAIEHLQPGGRVYVSVPNRDRIAASLFSTPLDHPPHHVSRWSAGQAAFLADRFGLEPIEKVEQSLSIREAAGMARAMLPGSSHPRPRLRFKGRPLRGITRGHTLLMGFRRR